MAAAAGQRRLCAHGWSQQGVLFVVRRAGHGATHGATHGSNGAREGRA